MAFDPLAFFGPAYCTQPLDLDTVHCVRTAVNEPFRAVLNVTKNDKFPGPMVVSLSRLHLREHLAGEPSAHMAYPDEHVVPWVQARKRTLLPVGRSSLGSAGSGPFGRLLGKAPALDIMSVDFGTADGLFLVPDHDAVPIWDVDYGTNDGLFLIVKRPGTETKTKNT